MKKSCRVTFQPEGLSVHVLEGTSLLEAAGDAGIVIDTPCGGKGTCGKCRIKFLSGTIDPSAPDTGTLTTEEIELGFRLACQSKIVSDIVVEIPYSSRFFEQKILTDGEGDTPFEPCLEKKCVEVPEPSLDNIQSDQERALSVLGAPSIPLAVVRELPNMLRRNDRRITAVLDCGEVVTIEPGDTSGALLGTAFDVGTTTVVGELTDLKTGRRLHVGSRTNPQVSFGDDVVSRIEHASTGKGLQELRDAIVTCLNDILAELADKQKIDTSHIYEVTIVGNTTMTHLLLGIDPTYIAQAPYPSVVAKAVRSPVWEVGLSINPRGLVYVLPNVAGFVGSDTVGVTLSTGMFSSDSIKLAVDIGTNGEIVLGSRKSLLCCSTAAGPAFEGARISQGMRAMPGAIEKVVIAEDVSTNTIGGEKPRGICGSGLIDVVAELLRAGIIDETGRILTGNDLPATVPATLRKRIVENNGEPGFAITTRDEGGSVVLTQRDVREVQLAKGAVYAGIATLKEEAGIEYEDISEVLLAGAMANFIRRSNAKRIGLLPDISTEKIRFVGNAALAGARMALASRSCRIHAEEISRASTYVELAGRTDFQMLFSEAMLFPIR